MQVNCTLDILVESFRFPVVCQVWNCLDACANFRKRGKYQDQTEYVALYTYQLLPIKLVSALAALL